MRLVRVVDSHTGGEPTRVVVEGGPDLGKGSLAERRERFRSDFDHYRSAIVAEPRGSEAVVGALLCEPEDPGCETGVIFFDNAGYLGMCGHGTIGLVVTLGHLRRMTAGRCRIETPVGVVLAELRADGRVSVINVPSHRHQAGVTVEVEGHGRVTGDVAWGGNWFFLTTAQGMEISLDNIEALTSFAGRTRRALFAAGVRGIGGAEIDHVELFGPSPRTDVASRNFVLCPGGAYDRSPCGTGTSAKLACLHAEGKLRPGEVWRQESVTGSVFEGRFALDPAQAGRILPEITGAAHVTGEATLFLDEGDPLCWGIPGARVSKRILVVGAGVVGLSTAYYAAGKGHRVTVVDRGNAESRGCSFGNAGMLVPSHVVPLAAPGTVGRGLRWMWNSESPFYVKPRLSAGLLGWGLRFWHASSPEHVARSAPLLRDLHLSSRACYEEWSAQWGADFGLRKNGLLMLCHTERGLEEETRAASRARDLGIPAEVLDVEGTAEREPALKMDVRGSVFYPLDAHLVPDRLMASLQRRLATQGVRFSWKTEARRWITGGGRIIGLRTNQGELSADEYVLCAGAWSEAAGRELGLTLPLQAGKGYSLTLPSPRRLPSLCAILSEAHVAVTPMGSALRVGGTMELAGLDEAIDPARVRGIVNAVPRYFPEFTGADFDGIEPWCGLRPCSPDGLPYVGRSARYTNLSVATGHAMMGVSLGPVTGRLIAEILSDERPHLDVGALDPDRYS